MPRDDKAVAIDPIISARTFFPKLNFVVYDWKPV